MNSDGAHPLIESDRFEVLELLGQGGFGQVYKARDLKYDTLVALKLLPELSGDSLYRLKREYRIVQAMAHPNVVRVLDLVATESNQTLMTMELLSGLHLDQFLQERRGSNAHSSSIASTFSQLAQGLSYIHSHGVVHRDLKPSNVMVTEDDRVVLLDFGFANDSVEWVQKSASVLGSAGYAARELLAGESAGPKADWYSVGVMLQEAITGRRGRKVLPEVPRAFQGHLKKLLHDNPDERGATSEVEQICHVLSDTEEATSAGFENQKTRMFIARDSEIDRLDQLRKRDREGNTVTGAWIEGPSGIGKTRLVHEYISRKHKNSVVLPARCNPSETLPFGVLDPLVDSLTEYLCNSGIRPMIARSAKQTEYLLQLFPVLRRVPGFEQQDIRASITQDAQSRTQGIDSLGRLLRELSEDEPVVIWIDDAQWSSSGDIALLESLIFGEYKPRLFLLITSREETTDELSEPSGIRSARHNIDRLASRSGVRLDRFNLAPLQSDSAQTLAKSMIFESAETEDSTLESPLSPGLLGEYVDTCEGNPLLIEQLGWHLRTNRHFSNELPENWLINRFTHLDSEDQRIVELLAVCGHPLNEKCLHELGAKETKNLTSLTTNGWLRRRTYKGESCFDIYHDIVKSRVTKTLEAREIQRLHISIAAALIETDTGSASELVTHYIAGNKSQKAERLALNGAKEAKTRLAWGQAASLFKNAANLDASPTSKIELLTEAAVCLRLDLRQVEAAELLTQASALARDANDTTRATKLLMDSAISYMQGGDLRQGRQALKECAADLDVKLSTDLLPQLIPRLSMALTTPRIATSRQRRVSSETETLGQLTYSLTHVDVNFAHGVLMQWIRNSKRAGDHIGLGRALLIEATVHGYISGPLRKSGRRLFVDAWKLLPHNSEERATAMAHLAQLAFGDGDWERTWRRTQLAEKIHKKVGSQWYGYSWFYLSYDMAASAMLGKLSYMAKRLPELASEARIRNDLLSQSFYDGALSAYGWLAMDKADHVLNATAQLDQQLSAQDFTSHTFYEVIGRVPAMHYSEQYTEAWAYMQQKWPQLMAAGFSSIKSQFLLLTINYLNSAAAVIAHSSENHNDAKDSARKILEQHTKSLLKYPVPAGRVFALQYQAALYLADGKLANAIDSLSRAAAGFRQQKMRLHAAAAQYKAAQLGNDETTMAAMTREFIAENVVSPQAMQRAYIPF